MVYLIYGEEPYKRDINVKKISKDAIVRSVESFTPDCRGVLESNSFLGRNVLILKVVSLGADDKLLKYLKEFQPVQNDFIIVADKIDMRTNFCKYLAKNVTLIRCEKLSRNDLVSHCLSGMKKLNIQITENAMAALIDRSGYLLDANISLYKINIYLKQLAISTNAVRIEDVEAIVPRYAGEKAFALLSLVIAGKKKELMELAVELLRAEEKPIRVFGLMLRNLRIAYKANLFQDKNEKELCAILGLDAYMMRQVSDVRRLPMETINGFMVILQEATSEIKGGLMPAQSSFICALGKMVSKV